MQQGRQKYIAVIGLVWLQDILKAHWNGDFLFRQMISIFGTENCFHHNSKETQFLRFRNRYGACKCFEKKSNLDEFRLVRLVFPVTLLSWNPMTAIDRLVYGWLSGVANFQFWDKCINLWVHAYPDALFERKAWTPRPEVCILFDGSIVLNSTMSKNLLFEDSKAMQSEGTR